jgi:hypothetical protein
LFQGGDGGFLVSGRSFLKKKTEVLVHRTKDIPSGGGHTTDTFDTVGKLSALMV